MTTRRSSRNRAALLGALGLVPLLAGSAPTSTQDVGQDGKPKLPIRPKLEDVLPSAQPNDPQQEMIDLFHKVEHRLHEMRRWMMDASAGDRSRLSELGASGIDELIRRARPDGKPTGGVGDLLAASRGHGQGVLEEIDRILEIAEENGGSCSSSMGDSPEGETPKQGGQTADNRSESAEREPGQPKDGPRPEDPQQARGEQPKDGQGNPEPGETRRASRAPEDETQEAGPNPIGAEEWGNLPIHVRELFRAEGGRDLPPRYRDWIDSYYRRLNRRSGG